jgi:hypothetical protein
MCNTRLARTLMGVVVAGALLFAVPGVAFAAPAVNSAGFNHHIAYDLKSMQTTAFHAQVNTPGVYAVLKVSTTRGDVVLYRGAINVANQDVTLATWNGMGPDGKRLPSSIAYVWTLTISKGGTYASESGTVSVSRIRFDLSGAAYPGSGQAVYSRYMLPGNANVYVFALVEGDPDAPPGTGSLGARIHGVVPGAYTRSIPSAGSYPVDATKPLRVTAYLRGADSIPDKGMHPVAVSAAAEATFMGWSVTVIQ